jgi:predicted dehydrogenase
MVVMNPIEFAVVGAGWRTEFFLRIARALPERFRIVGLTVRNPDRAKSIESAWSVTTFPDITRLLTGCRPGFVIVSVPQPAAPSIIAELVDRNVVVLTETPPAPTRESLIDLWRLVERGARIQVAEQYTWQPLHAARLALVRSGRLGEPTFAHVSACHGYHGTSLIRHFLGIGFEPATVTARAFEANIVAGPGRAGPPSSEKLTTSRQVIAQLDFGGKLGIYDFTGDQYFSWIRSLSVMVRGSRGEIRDYAARWLEAFDKPVYCELLRQNAGEDGNLEGLWHKGYSAAGEWLYRNPFPYVSLSDDEIAIAAVLEGMKAYLEDGKDIYSFAEAAQDQVLSLAINEAVETGRPVEAGRQPWATSAQVS